MTERLNVSDLGRRWGAVWAQRAIIAAVKSDGAVPTRANVEMVEDFAARVAELREVGLAQPHIDHFAKVATAEMERRFSLATRAVVV